MQIIKISVIFEKKSFTCETFEDIMFPPTSSISYR